MSKTTLMWVVGIGITIYLANNAQTSTTTTQTQTSFVGGLLTGGLGAALLLFAF